MTQTTQPDAGGTGTRTPLEPRQRRLLATLLPANLGIYAVWGATVGVMLQAQVEQISPGTKEASYAVVAGVGAGVALVAQPVAGLVSDRTRSRFGRRGPWIVLGALLGALFLVGLGSASTVVQLALAWCGVQLTLNFAQGPLTAVLPDRVPPARRGVFSSVMGLGLLAGMICGQLIGSQLVPHFLLGYALFGGFAVLTAVVFVLVNPEPSTKGMTRPRMQLMDVLRTFWVNPIRHPDFAWAFAGRFLMNLSGNIALTYGYFLLQDYVGLSAKDALATVPLISVVSVVGALVTTPFAGPLSDRFGRRRPFVFAAAGIAAVGLFVPFVLPTVTGMLIFGFVNGLGAGIFQSVDTALITQVLPSSERYGKDLGIVNIAATLPQTIAPALAGVIVLHLGGYRGVFLWGAALGLLGAFSVWRIRSVK